MINDVFSVIPLFHYYLQRTRRAGSTTEDIERGKIIVKVTSALPLTLKLFLFAAKYYVTKGKILQLIS